MVGPGDIWRNPGVHETCIFELVLTDFHRILMKSKLEDAKDLYIILMTNERRVAEIGRGSMPSKNFKIGHPQ